MYYDDPYDPTLENDYDDEPVIQREYEPSLEDESTVNTQRRQKKMKDSFLLAQKGNYEIKRTLNNKQVKVQVCETSTTPGSLIRDAISGAKFANCRVGSCDENMFFKVKLSSGEEELKGACPALFFESPEQYERHMGSTVSKETKERWTAKYYKESVARK